MPVQDRLADRDPLEVLRSTPDQLERIVSTHAPEFLRARPFEGKWTPNEILGHLVDHEIVSACRARTTRFDTDAWLGSYDQETWVSRQGHNETEPEEFVRRFVFLRELNLTQYTDLSPEERSCEKTRVDGQGMVTLDGLIRRHASHDLTHLDQLERYISALRQ